MLCGAILCSFGKQQKAFVIMCDAVRVTFNLLCVIVTVVSHLAVERMHHASSTIPFASWYQHTTTR